MIAETATEREKRRRQRMLFDSIAESYDATRERYPEEIVDELFATAGLGAGSPVLEVGCGTGQLTSQLAERGVALTAIDIGPSMVAAATRHVDGLDVSLRVCAFEDLEAPQGSFAAIVSATAFHWIDPDVAWAKSAELLQPGGWIAVLSTGERYDEPLAGSYREQWIRYSDDGGAWTTVRRPTLVETIAATRLFDDAVTSVHHRRRTVAAEVMIALECTRATFLSYDAATQERFVAELRQLLDGQAEVPLTQETMMTMARVKATTPELQR